MACAARAGVEHLLRNVKDATVSTLSTNVTAKLSALKGLESRLLEIQEYLGLVLDGKLPLNQDILTYLQVRAWEGRGGEGGAWVKQLVHAHAVTGPHVHMRLAMAFSWEHGRQGWQPHRHWRTSWWVGQANDNALVAAGECDWAHAMHAPCQACCATAWQEADAHMYFVRPTPCLTTC